MANIAIVQKCPSNVKYEKFFGFDFHLYNMASIKVKRLLKKDVDLEFDSTAYDWVICVGSEAMKHFTGKTGVADFSGRVVKDNFIALASPAQLHFKPEMRESFEWATDNIAKVVTGSGERISLPFVQTIRDTASAIAYLWEVLNQPNPNVAYDLETSTFQPRIGYILGFCFAYNTTHGCYIDADCFDEECARLLALIFQQKRIIGHNLKFDMHWTKYHLNIDWPENQNFDDTMMLHYLLDETKGSHGLKSLSLKYASMGDYDSELDVFKTSYCKTHGIKKEEFSYAYIPFELISVYGAMDAVATMRLYEKFKPIVDRSARLHYVHRTILMPGIKFLQEIEDNGVPFSRERLMIARDLLVQKTLEAEEVLYKFNEVVRFEQDAGERFNPNSTVQLRKLMFDYVGLRPTGKKTDGGADSTDAEVLKELGQFHEIPRQILKVRKYTKLKNTYVDKILKSMSADGRLRTGFHLHTTTSGRLSSSGTLNMQQLPRDCIIKSTIKARPGYKIVSTDLKTAEMYYASVLSGDDTLKAMFINGQDVHGTTARDSFKLDCDPNDVATLYPDYRQAAKGIGFGVVYQASPPTVADQINKPRKEQFLDTGEPYDEFTDKEAKDAMNEFFAKNKILYRWMQERNNDIKQNGYVYSVFGRKRRLKNVFSSDRGLAASEVRSGFNMLVQSVSSDCNLLGAMEAHNECRAKNLDVTIFGLVHDSTLAEVLDEHVDEYNSIFKRCMQKERFGVKGEKVFIDDCPVGLDVEGISPDYAHGKLQKAWPDLNAMYEERGV